MPSPYTHIFYTDKVMSIFSTEALIKTMLRVESALAKAQAAHGLIPHAAASAIEKVCLQGKIRIDTVILEGGKGGNLVIPLVNQLIVLVKEESKEASRYVHFGTTSQDIIDTTLMIQLKDVATIILDDLGLLMGKLRQLSLDHKKTVMAGRSFLQHARPISFGYKSAGWLDALQRSAQEIRSLAENTFALQLGGAVGTLSHMQEKGESIIDSMSKALRLSSPDKPWHSHRDRLAAIAGAFAILAGNLGKMAKDISLMSQTEVGELRESGQKGRGGSSTMPQKSNPIASISILANAQRVPALVSIVLSSLVQDHERGTGPWHAEWETLPEIAQLTAGALGKALELIHGLEINKEQMLKNLEITKGLIYAENISMALLPLVGRLEAYELVKACCDKAKASDLHLSKVCIDHPVISKYFSGEELEKLFDPERALGLSEAFIDKVVKKLS